jgi:hypothetical protein
VCVCVCVKSKRNYYDKVNTLRVAELARKVSIEILSWNMLKELRKPRKRSVRTAYILTYIKMQDIKFRRSS